MDTKNDVKNRIKKWAKKRRNFVAMRNFPNRIFVAFDDDCIPNTDSVTKRDVEMIELERRAVEDVMFHGCLKHPREWFGRFKKPVKCAIYQVHSINTIAPLTDRELKQHFSMRIADKWK
jgi:hypothetical protein